MKHTALLLFIVLSLTRGQDGASEAGPFTIDWEREAWIAGGGVLLGTAALAADRDFAPPTPADLAALDRSSVNGFDRFAAGRYSSSQMVMSDVTAALAIASPLALALDERVRSDWMTAAVLYAEVGLYSGIVPFIAKGAVRRYRPYTYAADAPMEERQDPDAIRSFFSGHATRSFAPAVLTAVMYQEYFPDSPHRTLVWSACLGTAALCSALRISSGAHFPTDVLAGAAVGSAIGYIIPAMHKRKAGIVLTPLLLRDGHGIALQVRF
ncbi:MAG: phosphatase PAP2 family protein [Bacteroidetes bacterium]|nr:MAG: phosphatase PAP2 family protein [Bacteroidota bacterium]